MRYLQNQPIYFLTSWRPVLFGEPTIITIDGSIDSLQALENLIIERLGSSLRLEKDIPFTIIVTDQTGQACSRCSWDKFCPGCPITDEILTSLRSTESITLNFDVQSLSCYIERTQEVTAHESVEKEEQKKEAPLTIEECLELFVEEENLDDNESWYCPQCKEFRPATKKLDIWKLPLWS